MDYPANLSAIEGQELSSVTFVQDYLQLEFNGPVLTLFIWPEVFRSEGSYAFGEPGYRDMLCGEIANTVSTTSWETGVAIELEFESGVIFRTSLRDEDYDGPEAGQYRTGLPDDPLIVF
jgi:hypothetical protein